MDNLDSSSGHDVQKVVISLDLFNELVKTHFHTMFDVIRERGIQTYNKLKRSQDILDCLSNAGIDNTEAYAYGMQQYYLDHPEEE